MGLFQKALETYESHLNYTENREGMTMMAPVGHIVTRADLEITLDPEGNFVIATAVDKSESKIVIPASESSAGRTNTKVAPHPHPLCEKLGYLFAQNEKKYSDYVNQLRDWASSEYSHPKLNPILQYVMGGTILDDLERCDVIKRNENGLPSKDKFIRWRVQGEEIEECWRDTDLFKAYTEYTLSQTKREQGLCMVTGEWTKITNNHQRGVFSLREKAKLISANDDSDFTYRGRFSKDWQAATVGYETSQKAHNALRWLISEQGAIFGKSVFLCWNPQGKTVMQPTLPFRPAQAVWQPEDYRDELRKTLNSQKRDFSITDGVVVAAFDAATTGRLAVTYYNELQAHDFLQRLHDWDSTCCWPHRSFGIQSPSLGQIVNCAFGTQKTEKGVTSMSTDAKIMRQEIQRLITCRVERAPMGADIVKALAGRASQPQAYERDVWESILFTACAVIRKYRYDRFKEEWNMALETDKKDRSYQYGRLLAVMEMVERETYDEDEKREPNAMRLQSVFCQRPLYVANNIQKQLDQAYFRHLEPGRRNWYKSIISQIMGIISEESEDRWNAPLDATYLMGYYLQRSVLDTKNTKDTEENENERTGE